MKIEETKEGLKFTRRDGTGSMTLTEPNVTGDHYAEFGKDNAGGISDAPSDTKNYGRKDAAWVEVAAKTHTHTDADINSTGASSGDVLTADGSGGASWQAGGGGGVVNFDDNAYTASPNNTTNVSALEAKGSTANVDFALKPKGSGAILTTVPDGTVTGGNKRGTYAVDLQAYRVSAAQVASGSYSVVSGGGRNTASGTDATVGGGERNTASGAQTTISGGHDNTANGSNAAVSGGYFNTASGAQTTISGGWLNVASMNSAVVGGGQNNTASGEHTTVGGGLQNVANGNYTNVCGGYSNTANGSYSVVLGGSSNTTNAKGFSIVGGALAMARNTSDFVIGISGGVSGDMQRRETICYDVTTDATPKNMSDRQVALACTAPFRGYVVGRSPVAGGEYCVFAIDGVINYGGTVGTGSLVVSNVTVVHRTTATLDVALAAATTGDPALRITVTGKAATSMRWLADIHFTDLVY